MPALFLVDPPSARESRAPTNQSVLFTILTATESRKGADAAAFEVVKNHVSPFYARLTSLLCVEEIIGAKMMVDILNYR